MILLHWVTNFLLRSSLSSYSVNGARYKSSTPEYLCAVMKSDTHIDNQLVIENAHITGHNFVL